MKNNTLKTSGLSKRILGISTALILFGLPASGQAQTQGDILNTMIQPPPSAEIAEVNELTGEALVSAPESTELQPVDSTVENTQNDTAAIAPLPDPVASDDFDENIFFDAQSLVPQGEMGRKGGPKKVNPRLQPASKFVIVKKNYSAGSKKSQLVAAERAMKLGRYDSALSIYERAYATNKRDPNILLGRAVALQKLERNDEAIEVYDQLLTLRPNNVEAQINMLGLMARQYPAVALQRLNDLSEKNPHNVGIIAQLAFIQARLHNNQNAIRYLGMAASMEPENANHIYNMAVIADRSGSKKEAIRYYEQALEVDTLYGAGKTIPRESVFQRLASLR